MTISRLSNTRLKGLHPDLDAVVRRAVAIADVQVLVVEGMRSMARQKELVAKGASTTLKSRHLTGHAVDLVAMVGKDLKWGKPYSGKIADAMKRAAAELDVDIEWGGDWKSFVDTPHFQLAWASYPKQDAPVADTSIDRPVTTAARKSMTIFGAISAGLGYIVIAFEKAIQFATEAVAAMSDLAPVQQMASAVGANVSALGYGIGGAGIAIVIVRRLHDAMKGRS